MTAGGLAAWTGNPGKAIHNLNLRYGKASDAVLDRSVYKRLGDTLALSPTEKDIPYAVLYTGEGESQLLHYDKVISPATKKMESCGTPGCAEVSCCSLNASDVGYLSVIAAVNNLAADGYQARSIKTAVLLPANSPEETLRRIEDQIREAAQLTGVVITGGHTEVTHAVTRPLVTTSAYGLPYLSGLPETTDIRLAGDVIWHMVIAGAAGMEGTYLLAKEKKELLARHFPARFLDQASCLRNKLCVSMAAATAAGLQLPQPLLRSIPVMVNASEGGIFAALWNFSQKAGRILHLHGFDIDLLKIPLYQETIEISDYFSINPYNLLSEGCLIVAVPEMKLAGAWPGGANYIETMLAALTRLEIPAVDVGILTDSNNRRLHNADEIRFLDAPAPDAISGILG